MHEGLVIIWLLTLFILTCTNFMPSNVCSHNNVQQVCTSSTFIYPSPHFAICISLNVSLWLCYNLLYVAWIPLIFVSVESGLIHVRYHMLSHIACVMTIHYLFSRMNIQVFTFTVQKPSHTVLSVGGIVTSVIAWIPGAQCHCYLFIVVGLIV